MANKKSNVTDFSKKQKEASRGREVVRRSEMIDVMTQVSQNIAEMSKYLMEDMNTMFRKYTYPNTVKLQALEELLEEKGSVTRVDLEARYKKIIEDAVKKAQPVDDKGNPIPANSETAKAIENVKIEIKDSAEVEEGVHDFEETVNIEKS